MDKFSIEMDIEQLIAYIRKTPQKFTDQLPEKLRSWLARQSVEVIVAQESTKEFGMPVNLVSKEQQALKEKIVTEVSINMADGRQSPGETVDYALDVALEVIKRLRE
jgi:hypothetical protein